MILFRAPVNDTIEFDLNYHYSPSIVFSNAESLNGKKVIPTLTKFADIVEGVTMAIEAEARSLGLC